MNEHHGGDFGVYFRHKIQKLRAQNAALQQRPPDADAGGRPISSAASSGGRSIFAGVHVCVDGYTTPPKEELRLLLLAHGGGFEHYETRRVTHVVASRLSGSKLLQLK